MWNVEDHFVDKRLCRQARRRKNELLRWVVVGVDSRVDRWAAFVEGDVGVSAQRDGSEDVRGLVRQDARAEAEGKPSPVIVRRRGSIRCRTLLRNGRCRYADEEHQTCQSNDHTAGESQTCYVLRRISCTEQDTDGG